MAGAHLEMLAEGSVLQDRITAGAYVVRAVGQKVCGTSFDECGGTPGAAGGYGGMHQNPY